MFSESPLVVCCSQGSQSQQARVGTSSTFLIAAVHITPIGPFFWSLQTQTAQLDTSQWDSLNYMRPQPPTRPRRLVRTQLKTQPALVHSRVSAPRTAPCPTVLSEELSVVLKQQRRSSTLMIQLLLCVY